MIDVLLAVRDGERYLPAQLESLRAQTEGGFRILAHDDGSHDSSPELLRRAAAEDARLHVLDGAPTGSACGNFFLLLSASDAPYAMFCDQDDMWREDKIALTLDAMRRAEERLGADTPILVHTDLAVTDAEGTVTAPSMMELQRLCPGRQDLPRLLCQSLVTGCTVMINAPLRRLLLAHPHEGALMHDWWASLIAAALGEIVYVPEATVGYRQHGGNAVGARDARSLRYRLSRLGELSAVRAALRATNEQAAAFYAAFGGLLSPADAALVRDYAAVPSLNALARRAALCRLGTLKSDPVRRIAQLLLV